MPQQNLDRMKQQLSVCCGNSGRQHAALNRFRSHPQTCSAASAWSAGDQRLSFGTYFNAFPASYWRKWTVATKTVLLGVETDGSGTILVYRSTREAYAASGVGHAARRQAIIFELPMHPFGDGGWYWFDSGGRCYDDEADERDWAVPGPTNLTRARLNVGSHHLQPADYCVRTIAAIARVGPELRR